MPYALTSVNAGPLGTELFGDHLSLGHSSSTALAVLTAWNTLLPDIFRVYSLSLSQVLFKWQ